jgi:hypothetical protein
MRPPIECTKVIIPLKYFGLAWTSDFGPALAPALTPVVPPCACSSHRYSDCLSSSIEFKIAADEFIVGAFVFKKDYLTERFSARLEAY